MAHRSRWLTGVAALLLAAAMLWLVAPGWLSRASLAISQRYLSPDGILEVQAQQTVVRVLRVSGLVGTVWSLILLRLAADRRSEARARWLRDPLIPGAAPWIARAVLWGGTLLSAALVAAFAGRYSLGLRVFFAEDGPSENATVLLYGVAVLLLVRAWRALRTVHWARRRALVAILALLLVGCVVMAGEELSWGQRIVGWRTPAWMQRLNDQGETNLHNMVSPLFHRMRPAMAWALPLALLAAELAPKRFQRSAWMVLVPHRALWGMLSVLAVASAVPLGEAAEVTLSLVVAAYALRLALAAPRLATCLAARSASEADALLPPDVKGAPI